MLDLSVPFSFVALTPPGLYDPAIAIAASRAGGIGVLDLEYAQDRPQAQAAITRLAGLARNACGVKLAPVTDSFTEQIVADLPDRVRVVILAPAPMEMLARHVRLLRKSERTILLEATDLEEAKRGERLGVDGLIAKGHEAGGRVGEETTFVLLQRLLARATLPVYAHGGIGLHTAPACYAAGASGAVLDAQLFLARESPLSTLTREQVARMDGSETEYLRDGKKGGYRLYGRPGLASVEAVRQYGPDMRAAVRERAGWSREDVWLLGQDAAFAAQLADRYRTVGGILEAFRSAIDQHVQAAQRLQPLGEDGPLAQSHGTRYPIVQGPMTRVSDSASFAASVAAGGALPFLALALMRADEADSLLRDTRRMLGDRPWGVGILGFVPSDLRHEQLAVIRSHRPDFALIAGGRPDQALTLEEAGIPTYLHVPSPRLLQLFAEHGARRFIFEGRECGGHVGPRASSVLWNVMIETLLESLSDEELADCHVLFAGGIHDARSAAMVAAMASPLCQQGARVGVLLGTAYLFTEEAVSTGAITPAFQREAVRCDRTVLLESGPGHATRCAETPFASVFEQERRRLQHEGAAAEAIRETLENLNLGRLRIATKGINRHPNYEVDPQAPKFVTLSEREQRDDGLFMIGQVAACRDEVCTIDALHREVSVEGSKRISQLPVPGLTRSELRRDETPFDVAVIGMACILPGAANLGAYWENILNKVDAITEIPADRWDWRTYFDEDPKARDKIYSRWGGFIDDVPFDPVRYGMPPNSLASIEPLQVLTLEVVRAALDDAGYLGRPFPRRRTSVILGAGGGTAALGNRYAVRSALPMYLGADAAGAMARLPEWTEDSFPGILLNVAAGRVANRFDLGGVNYVVDAACASSLAAVHLAARELEAGTSEMVIAGGVEAVQEPFGYLAFSKTHALSPTGRCRTFDAGADGIAISEGLAMLVLKRLEDAERDGDRVYAVIKGIAGSSDGKDKGLTAPRPEGQALALERAYEKAGFSASTVGLIEAHGTGTVVGDKTEVAVLRSVFEASGAARQQCAIGSVKSMIGHTKCTAGVAGLIKAALALHHKVVPPTLHVETPNPEARFPESPFYVNTEARPWIHGTGDTPRRAGVSAFGFGGTNFHAVLEEYTESVVSADRTATLPSWPAELMIWRRAGREPLCEALTSLAEALSRGARPSLADLAYTLWQQARDETGSTLALVATSLEDLRQKLAFALEALRKPDASIHDPRGLYYTEAPLGPAGRLAFLFSGQGSQYPGMLSELGLHFDEVRLPFERADRVLAERFPERLSTRIYPPPAFTTDERQAQQRALTQTDVAQPALGAAGVGLYRLLQRLGVRPDLAAGHSYGEYVALWSAGVFGEETLYRLSEARGRSIIDAAEGGLGTMAAVRESLERVRELLSPLDDVWIANVNAPKQTVISGTLEGIDRAVDRLEGEGIAARTLTVACAFHSPLVAPAGDRLAETLAKVEFQPPRHSVYANATASPYPDEPEAIASLLGEHLVRPVRFAEEVSALHDAGARIFVELGPNRVLAGLTEQILEDRPDVALALDAPGTSGLVQLLRVLGRLATHRVPLDLDRLFEGRTVRRLHLGALEDETRPPSLSPTTWLVNGGQARPAASDPPSRETGSVAGRQPVPSPLQAAPRAEPPAGPHGGARSMPSWPVASNGADSPASRSRQDSTRVMQQFQQMMSTFLETQRDVMMSYLHGSGQEAASVEPTPPARNRPATAADAGLESAASRPEQKEASPTEQNGRPDAPPTEQGKPFPIDKDDLTGKLLNLVSDRTGYPVEMLGLDLNLESDLSIDSIKRVEIIGAFRRTYFSSVTEPPRDAMDRLTGVKTLREIVDVLCTLHEAPRASDASSPSTGSAERAPASSDAGSPPHAAVPSRTESAERATVRPRSDSADDVAAPSGGGSAAHAPSPTTKVSLRGSLPRFLLTPEASRLLPEGGLRTVGVLLLTDDERGVAAHLAKMLTDQGRRVVTVGMGSAFDASDEGAFRADLTQAGDVQRVVAAIRERHGPIAGVVHLLPLRSAPPFEEMDVGAWQERLALETKSLFLLAQCAAADLRSAGEGGSARLLAATSMGGTFGSESPAAMPSQGGLCGFVKTCALEWPDVSCRVVDFDPQEAPSVMALRIAAEMAAPGGDVEVGYQGDRRLVFRVRSAPLIEEREERESRPELDEDSIILVTGGARGITAEGAIELARRYRPTLVLVGRSPLPAEEESSETVGLEEPSVLKAALMETMRRGGEEVVPARVEAVFARLLKDREMRAAVGAMRAAGARVAYHQVDVRDAERFGALIDQIYDEYGRIDGVIHGAGVIEDKLIVDKEPDSFDRVLGPKLLGAFTLSRKLRPATLRFLVFFGSVAGRFGNRGQSDYAAANEAMNKLAVRLDHLWPARVVAMNWGPWAGSGMASPEVRRQFAERGIHVIDPSEGRRALDLELSYGRKGDVEVVLGAGPWAASISADTRYTEVAFPE